MGVHNSICQVRNISAAIFSNWYFLVIFKQSFLSHTYFTEELFSQSTYTFQFQNVSLNGKHYFMALLVSVYHVLF